MLKKYFIFVILFATVGTALIYSGRYDISATTPHLPPIQRIISETVNHSVKHHAKGIVAPSLEDTAMVRLGFVHYREMCVECHGAPGVQREEFAKGLYPRPPGLQRAVEEWGPSELYWMTKFGIKMSGMPAFGKTHNDHELWSIVAFLKALPGMDSVAYAKFAAATAKAD